jgi:hypothetical protein
MRAALLALMAIGTLSAIDAAPAQARGGIFARSYITHTYPICMRTRQGDDDCSFDNFQQCQWTASGQGTTCFNNPALAYGQQYVEEPAPRHRHRRHHHHAD